MNPAPLRPAAAHQHWWQSIRFWRWSTAAALLLAAGLAIRLWTPASAPQTTRYVAVLQSTEKTDSSWIVEASPGGLLRLIPLFTTELPPQKSLQLWTRTAGSPTPLGAVAPDRVTEIDAARLPVLQRDQLFELTLEPAGGATGGRPAGPIVFVGRTVALDRP